MLKPAFGMGDEGSASLFTMGCLLHLAPLFPWPGLITSFIRRCIRIRWPHHFGGWGGKQSDAFASVKQYQLGYTTGLEALAFGIVVGLRALYVTNPRFVARHCC